MNKKMLFRGEDVEHDLNLGLKKNSERKLTTVFLMREVTSALFPLPFFGCSVIIHTRHVSL